MAEKGSGMNRRDLLRLAGIGPLALCLRPRVRADGRRMRRSKPFIDRPGRGCLSWADERRLEERDRC